MADMLSLNAPPCKGPIDNETLPDHQIGTKPLECSNCLEYLNRCRLFTELHYSETWNKQTETNDLVLDKELNTRGKANMVRYFVKDMSLPEIYVFLKCMENATAEVALLYSNKVVKERIPDIAAIESGQKYDKASNDAIKAAQLANRPKTERKHLSDRDKAIEAIMKVPGMTREIAESMVNKKFKEQGKVTQ